MAISTALNSQFKADVMLGLHDLDTHVCKIALYSSAATLNATTPATTYSTTNELATAGGYTQGGATLTGGAVVLNGGEGILDFADASWTSATFTANGALIYNSNGGSNRIISTHAFGGDQTVSSGTFSVVFPAAAAGTAIVRIT